jgi:hypothetical protein
MEFRPTTRTRGDRFAARETVVVKARSAGVGSTAVGRFSKLFVLLPSFLKEGLGEFLRAYVALRNSGSSGDLPHGDGRIGNPSYGEGAELEASA